MRLTGHTTTVDTTTGEVLRSYTTSDEPTGTLLTACGNRRSSRCPACSRVYAADTYHLIRAGLTGGKTVPDTVRTHPRVFTTSPPPPSAPSTTAPPTRTAAPAPVAAASSTNPLTPCSAPR